MEEEKKKKEARKLVNLRYRMKKAGYIFNEINKVIILPIPRERSKKREREISKYGFDFQEKML